MTYSMISFLFATLYNELPAYEPRRESAFDADQD